MTSTRSYQIGKECSIISGVMALLAAIFEMPSTMLTEVLLIVFGVSAITSGLFLSDVSTSRYRNKCIFLVSFLILMTCYALIPGLEKFQERNLLNSWMYVLSGFGLLGMLVFGMTLAPDISSEERRTSPFSCADVEP